MLLGSLKLTDDYRTNDETHANSPREPRNEYALAAASVTDFQPSWWPRWGDGGRLARRLGLVGSVASPPFHQPASAALPTAPSILRPTALGILRLRRDIVENFDSPKSQTDAVNPRIRPPSLVDAAELCLDTGKTLISGAAIRKLPQSLFSVRILHLRSAIAISVA